MNESEHALQGPDEQASVLRGLLEAAVHAIVVVDERGEIVLVNPAAEALFAYDRGELIGESVEILVPERFRDSHGGQRRRFTSGALTRRMGIGLDLVACRKDGTEFPAEIGLSRIQTAGGVLISAAISDITERKSAEVELAQLAAIVESSDDAIIGKTLEGTITSWNPAAERIYGYTQAEAIGRHISMLCPTCEQEDEVARILGRVAAGERVEHFETTRRRKDGVVIDVSVTISPIRNRRWRGDGSVDGRAGHHRANARGGRAGGGRGALPRRVRGGADRDDDARPAAACAAGQRGDVPAAWSRPEELVGRSILDFTHADDVKRSVEWSESRSAGDVIAPLVKRYVRPDGSIVEAQVTTALVEPERSEPYFFSQLQDVTERRRAERQKAVIADLGRRAL